MLHRTPILVLGLALLAGACKKDEKPLLTATLQAKCRGCIVSYAAGPAQSRQDTLLGVVDPATGDTVAEEGHWSLQLGDGDNLFFRACRMDPDTAFGTIELQVGGDVRPVQAMAGTDQDCAEVNQAAHAR